MKWPTELILIRHDISEFNALRGTKQVSITYQNFAKAFDEDPLSSKTKGLAQQALEEIKLQCGDHNTPLVASEESAAETTGRAMKGKFDIPDVIFVSPYQRTLETFERIKVGWPELSGVKVYEDERIRELEHGLGILYNDWRIFFALHPEQKKLQDIQGRYWYRFPQGENVPDVRTRNRLWIATITRDFAGKRVMAISHHLNILATRANLERLDAEEFLRLDAEEKPINCGVTLYRGNPELGEDGRLELEFYNNKYY